MLMETREAGIPGSTSYVLLGTPAPGCFPAWNGYTGPSWHTMRTLVCLERGGPKAVQSTYVLNVESGLESLRERV